MNIPSTARTWLLALAAASGPLTLSTPASALPVVPTSASGTPDLAAGSGFFGGAFITWFQFEAAAEAEAARLAAALPVVAAPVATAAPEIGSIGGGYGTGGASGVGSGFAAGIAVTNINYSPGAVVVLSIPEPPTAALAALGLLCLAPALRRRPRQR